ncbi:uncharacterized protein UV8b_05114 [Ustilaginoidea virens]|uniref:Uncharacterized protein n=1 Tax=Ustilaginoidea virens TaxID=1159556 RepID=A0A8E5HT71_USTVR|nr:uncharacterized protein UV8b_05114 [Ustilaginoidea virens]QUC20873.1 hypothetical protein UV8b_05114 [Ustilaginoidea virens]
MSMPLEGRSQRTQMLVEEVLRHLVLSGNTKTSRPDRPNDIAAHGLPGCDCLKTATGLRSNNMETFKFPEYPDGRHCRYQSDVLMLMPPALSDRKLLLR